MMLTKKKWVKFMALLMTLCFASVLIAKKDEYDKYLNASEIEGVTGLSGIQKIPSPTKGPAGDLNFARQDGELFLVVRFYKESYYHQQKADEDMFGGEVLGIGDEAFNGPSYMEAKYFILFRKGERCVMLSTFLASSDGSSPMISIDHLTELAKIIANRMK